MKLSYFLFTACSLIGMLWCWGQPIPESAVPSSFLIGKCAASAALGAALGHNLVMLLCHLSGEQE